MKIAPPYDSWVFEEVTADLKEYLWLLATVWDSAHSKVVAACHSETADLLTDIDEIASLELSWALSLHDELRVLEGDVDGMTPKALENASECIAERVEAMKQRDREFDELPVVVVL